MPASPDRSQSPWFPSNRRSLWARIEQLERPANVSQFAPIEIERAFGPVGVPACLVAIEGVECRGKPCGWIPTRAISPPRGRPVASRASLDAQLALDPDHRPDADTHHGRGLPRASAFPQQPFDGG